MLPRPMAYHAVFLVLLALLASCATPSERVPFITVGSQPPNVGDAKIRALSYHDSGAYARDLAIVAEQAARWISGRAARGPAPSTDPGHR